MKSVLVLALLQLSSCALAIRRNAKADEDLMPGWLGTDFQPKVVRPDALSKASKMKVLDAEARIFLVSVCSSCFQRSLLTYLSFREVGELPLRR